MRTVKSLLLCALVVSQCAVFTTLANQGSFLPLNPVRNVQGDILNAEPQAVIAVDAPVQAANASEAAADEEGPVDAILQMAGVYDENASYEYCAYAVSSYCTKSRIEEWRCTTCKKYPDLTDIIVFKDRPSELQGYMGYNPKSNKLIVAFRGTLPWSIKDWIHDIDYFKTSYPYCSGCEVHEGFYKSYKILQPMFWDAYNILLQRHPDTPLVVIGHSLGGALAEFCAADLITTGHKGFTLYTYGAPRTGNPQFAAWLTASQSGYYARVTHGSDPVPHLPPESFGFRHSPQEIFYKLFNRKYKICSMTNGEDPDCSDKYLIDINVIDHLTYMGYDFAYDVLACQ